MKKSRRNLLITCVLAISLPVLTSQALAEGTLTIKCVDPTGNPVAGAKVIIQHFETNKVKDKKSDGKGIADFGKVDDGTYRVLGRKDGLAPALYEFASVKGNGQSVTLTFQTGDAASKLYFEDPAINSKAFEAFDLGLKSMREGKFTEGENQLKASIGINPSNPMVHFYLAVAYLQLQKLDLGEEELKKASTLASIMMSLPAKDPTAPNPYAEIKTKADEQLAKMPSIRLRAEGEKAFSQKQYDVAAAKFQEASKYDPKDADIYSYQAVALANLKKFDEASQAIDKAIQLSPAEKAFAATKERIANMRENDRLSQAQSVLNDGDKLYKGQDYAGALKKYEEALPLVSGTKQSIVYAAIARSNAGLNQPDKAIEAYKKAIEMSPDSPDYRKALAQFYLKEKRYEDALNLYAESKGAGSESADKTLFQLGQTLSNQGNGEVAALAFERAIKANPENAEAYYELGMLFFYDKKSDARAKELLEKYVQIGKNADHMSNTQNVLVVLKKRMGAK